MKNHIKPFMTVICVCVSLVCILKVLNLFKIGRNDSYQTIEGFYHERADSLDAVYIGASNVDRFWEPPLAWNDYGIAVMSYALPAESAIAFPYQINEIHKTQPNALLIISLNSFKNLNVSDSFIHRSTNYMHFSPNKISMINALTNEAGFKGFERLQYYFPAIRFHSRWSELKAWDFTHSINGLKTALNYSYFLADIEDLSEKYVIYDTESELTDKQAAFLEEFLEYLDQSGHPVLFVSSPQALSKTTNKRFNRMGSIIREHGYEYLDLVNGIDETGIQTKTDFYNNGHTNIHGAIKFTDYLAQYLIEHYGFTDKRGQPGWESWDESVGLYTDVIAPYTLEFEREHAPRDYELEAPILNKVKVEEQTITLSWKESPNAEGYDIYRKSAASGEKNWIYLTSTESDTLQYVDSELNPETKYTYTVVPKINTDGIERYGNFNFTGVSGTTK